MDKTPSDINKLASFIVDKITGKTREKHPGAVSLGRLGGLKGGPARHKALSKRRRHEIAKKAASARWKKH